MNSPSLRRFTNLFIHSCLIFLFVDGVVEQNITLNNSSVTVQTPHGKIRGKTVILPTNKGVDLFLGIPYAKAGRFEAPRSTEKWQNVLNAANYGKPCPQPLNPQLRSFDSMSEDCLFMNIFVPSRRSDNETLLPVMFYIHGGAFVFRSGQTDFSMLSSEGNVVVVSFNYRLGALGFLNTGLGEQQITGNFGMLDQVEALKWVHKNIESFGGDPNRITLFGSSSGSTCVSLLMLSPLTRGMYANVILASGSAHAIFATVRPQIAHQRARLFLEILGCKESAAQRCLKRKELPFSEILSAQMQINSPSMLLPFGPVVNGHFLTDEPAALLDKGEFGATNVIIGVTQDEGSVFLTPISGIVTGIPAIENGMSTSTFTETVEGSIWTQNQDNRTLKSIIYEYTDWSNRDNLNITRQNFVNLCSDAGFKAPAVLSAKKFAKKGLKTYLYQFEHASKYMNGAEVPFWKGVYHRADIHYVLGTPIRDAPNSNNTEATFSRRIVQLWTDFARTGAPTTPSDSFHWPRFNLETQQYAGLKPVFTVRSKLLSDKMAFWNELVPSLTQSAEPSQSPSPSACITVTCPRCPTVSRAPCHQCSGLLQRILIGAVAGLTVLLVILIAVLVCFIRKSRRKQKPEEYEIVATNL